ncbi:unnamed protein product [Ophioblennius macclurei]
MVTCVMLRPAQTSTQTRTPEPFADPQNPAEPSSTQQSDMSVSTVLAKALYDNTAESPEELAFRKGDILMVLEQEQNGGPGWWLCSLHGRQGIAPANRLRLLQTAPTPDSDSVYLSPGPPLACAADDLDGVYRSPPVAGEGRGGGGGARTGELRRGEGGRPRSHSSSGTRPRPDWDIGVAGRPRSPSLRGRGTDTTGTLYQSPASPAPAASESAYLAPGGTPRAADEPEDATYLVPRETLTAGYSDDCYLVPKGTPLAGEGVYQSPASNGLHIAPASAGAGLHRAYPSHPSPRPAPKGVPPNTAATRGKPGLACHRGSPLLIRAGQARAPGSPNFARKPPPPVPPVRSVTRKDGEAKPVTQAPPGDDQQFSKVRPSNGVEKRADPSEQDKDQVYDTPPSGRWQHPAPSGNDGIYDTPRCAPPQADPDPEAEVYDVPTLSLNASAAEAPPHEAEDEVYSVPTLPGVPMGPGESGGEDDQRDSSQPDCGVYDMPALAVELHPHPASIRRLSVSSTDSGDVQWRASLASLVHSVLNAASTLTSRDLASSLADILSTWKASHSAEPPPPLQQAWARLSDLLPALSAAGNAAPSEGLLSLVQRSLEESALLLQAQGRPRLPSQESLSRRPLPALPLPDGKVSGMGSRKGSWIQERPLPPTPQPTFALPPAPSAVTVMVGPDHGEEDPGNEYAGIGMTPVPALAPAGDSVGYVKLQGKPEPPPDVLDSNGQNITADPRLSPSPPLPGTLSLEDSELLSFYSSQSLAHLSCLADAIDVLFSSVQGNQPPRVFVARGKSLIVTAHKLVFIGDTLSRLLTSGDLRSKITTSGGRLCQALKAVVVATKGAAQNYPSVSATQEMVDRVAELSQHAAGFSTLLQRLAEISS